MITGKVDLVNTPLLQEIDSTAFQILKILQGKKLKIVSWAVGRALDLVPYCDLTGERVKTIEDYHRLRMNMISRPYGDNPIESEAKRKG